MITGVEETRFDGSYRNLERACHFRKVELHDLVKDKGLALSFRKLHERIPQHLSIFSVREASPEDTIPVRLTRKRIYVSAASAGTVETRCCESKTEGSICRDSPRVGHGP